MACRLIEGWESSTTASHYAGKWTSLTAGGIASSSGRNGQGLRLSTNGGLATRLFDAQATWTVGCALRYVAADFSALAILDGASVQDDLYVNAGGTLSVRRGGSTVLGTSALALLANTWSYVEWRTTVAGGTSGATEVRVNGVTWLSLPATNTQATANATAATVRLGSGGTMQSVVADYDDVYVFDGTGSVNTTFAGDCKVEQLVPNGAGATTAWTPSAGSNWQCVDDVPPNSDTDYVSSATAAQTDSYAYGNLVTTSGTVKAVQATAFARKDDAGSRSLALVARPGSTDRVGATQAVLDSYTMASEVWQTNPDTAAAWTIADVNAAAFGVRLIA